MIGEAPAGVEKDPGSLGFARDDTRTLGMTQEVATEKRTSEQKGVLAILRLVLGAGVTPAEGSVKPTAGFTFNKVISSSPSPLRDPLLRRSIASRYHGWTTSYAC